MCVLVVARTKFPTLEQLKQMEETNRDGAGIGWMQDGMAHWRKGLDAEQVFAIGSTLPLPVVIHFRMATVGGAVKELTHPFPVTPKSGLQLVGNALRVLFHNGHWNNWDDMMTAGRKRGVITGKQPKLMSDTRAMAMLTHAYGDGIPEMLGADGQRLVVLSGSGLEVYGKFQEWEGLEVSNINFTYKSCNTVKWGAPYDSDWGYGYESWGLTGEVGYYGDEEPYRKRGNRRGFHREGSLVKPRVENNPDGKCLFCHKTFVMDLRKGRTHCPDCSTALMTVDGDVPGAGIRLPLTPSISEPVDNGLKFSGPKVPLETGGFMQYSETLEEYVELVQASEADSPLTTVGAGVTEK